MAPDTTQARQAQNTDPTSRNKTVNFSLLTQKSSVMDPLFGQIQIQSSVPQTTEDIWNTIEWSVSRRGLWIVRTSDTKNMETKKKVFNINYTFLHPSFEVQSPGWIWPKSGFTTLTKVYKCTITIRFKVKKKKKKKKGPDFLLKIPTDLGPY